MITLKDPGAPAMTDRYCEVALTAGFMPKLAQDLASKSPFMLQVGPIADVVFGGAAPGGSGEAERLQRQLRLLSHINIIPANPYRVANTAGMRAPRIRLCRAWYCSKYNFFN